MEVVGLAINTLEAISMMFMSLYPKFDMSLVPFLNSHPSCRRLLKELAATCVTSISFFKLASSSAVI